jgi:cobalt/nickel transport system permease protein
LVPLPGPSIEMNRSSVLSYADPRGRILMAFVLGAILSFVQDDLSLLLGLGGGMVVAFFSGGGLWYWARRAVRWNIFFLIAIMTIPFASPGPALFHVGGFSYGSEGLYFSLKLLLRANALLFLFSSLVGQMDPFTLAHALRHLRVPERLTTLIFFVDRCQQLVSVESVLRLRALRARGYQSTWSFRSWRVWGNFVGALLLSSSDRADRCLGAMRCRGFDGHVQLYKHFKTRPLDIFLWTGAASWAVLLVVVARGS